MKNWAILCVDDEEYVLKALQRELIDALGANYSIETANGGKEALELFHILMKQEYEVPVVIADQIMPGMTGAELLIKIQEFAPKTMKIMLTGQADKDAITLALNRADLYRYIGKPWEHIDLTLTVKEAIRRYIHEKKLTHQNQLLRNINNSLERKVKERTRQLETQKSELARLNAGKDKFFSIIAHDLRTPFSGLIGTTGAILQYIQHLSQEEIREQVSALKESAETVFTLLENLLSWSRVQHGIMDYHPDAIALEELATRNIRLFASTAEYKQITLTNQIPQQIQVYADRNMLDTIVRNLLSNALKFTPSGGIVALSARQNGRGVEFSVSDTGVGIPSEDLPRLFKIDERYSHPGTHGEEGTGVGLLLCKELIEKNGGAIHVESEVKQGTIFTLLLPVYSPSLKA